MSVMPAPKRRRVRLTVIHPPSTTILMSQQINSLRLFSFLESIRVKMEKWKSERSVRLRKRISHHIFAFSHLVNHYLDIFFSFTFFFCIRHLFLYYIATGSGITFLSFAIFFFIIWFTSSLSFFFIISPKEWKGEDRRRNGNEGLINP